MQHRSTVRPSPCPLTDVDAREILSPVLIRLCAEHGPTAVGRAVVADPKTVRNARDEISTLGLETAANLLALDPTAFDGFLARVGRRSVPIDSVCDTDALPAMTGAVHKLVMAAAPGSIGGAALSRCELLGAEKDVRDAFDALGALLCRIDAAKLGVGA